MAVGIHDEQYRQSRRKVSDRHRRKIRAVTAAAMAELAGEQMTEPLRDGHERRENQQPSDQLEGTE